MVPSGNKDYIIIIIILWGIKDLSQPVSVALKNTSKSQHSVTKSIVQILKMYKKKKKKQTLNPEKERFTSSEQGQCAVLAVIELRLGKKKKNVLEWCLAAEFSYSSGNSFLSEMTNLCLDFLLYAGVTCELIFHRWQTTWIQAVAS